MQRQAKRAMFVWLPNWAMTRARLKQPPLAAPHEPLVLLEKDGNIRRITALDEPAIACGLFAGQPLADALAVCPALIAAEAEREADAEALARLAAWALRYSPMTAPAPPDGIFIDITGCAHLWGGETELAGDAVARLDARGIPARAAIADTFGAAWALARHTSRTFVAQPGEHRDLLLPLPVERLRISGETAAALRKLGLATIGAVSHLPRTGLARRFRDLLPRLDQAFGRVDEAIPFQKPHVPWIERIRFAAPIATIEDLERSLLELVTALCARLEEARQGALHWRAQFFRADGGVQEIAVSTALPARDPDRLMRLFREKLGLVDPGFGVDVVALEAEGVEAQASRQVSLLRSVKEAACVAELAALIESLDNRLGQGSVRRMEIAESYAPERAFRWTSPLAPVAEGVEAAALAKLGERPIRLLPRPEPIDVTAMLPDAPPILFRWRRLVHRVRRAEGPERLSAEWWRMSDPQAAPEHDEEAGIRDYYRVETQTGLRVWVYRRGSYSAGPPPRWYLQGLFA